MNRIRLFLKQNSIHCLAFLIPFAFLGIGFAVNGVYPFGNQQILVTDLYHQYYPFFLEFREILHSGGSLLWSWRAGLGANFLAIISYYLASPLNLIAALFPATLAREALTLMLMVKIGCSGLFMSVFLRRVFGRCETALLPFSLSYSLCAFTMGYYWNIMWYDTFAVLPLVVLGVCLLVLEGRFGLYTVSLALAVFMNFYIGFFVCIFTAISFFALCFIKRIPVGQVAVRLLRILLHSVTAIGMTALLTLPAWMALGKSYSVSGKPPTPAFRLTAMEMLGNLVAFGQPSSKEGLPNVYSGMLALLLAGAFLWSRRVQLREKIVAVALLAFLFVSCSYSTLDYLWHGFHMTNMIPYRFTFLISFIVATAGYRAWLLMEEFRSGEWAAMALVAVGVHACALIGKSQHPFSIAASFALAMGIILLLMHREKGLAVQTLLVLLITGEFIANAIIGVSTVQTTSRSYYSASDADVKALLAVRDSLEGDAFSRVETVSNFISNDPLLYGYNGVSLFSSTANVSVTRFLDALGLSCWVSGNRYYYVESTPLNNALLNVKYLFARDGAVATPDYWDEVAASGNATLYRNRAALPFAFMAEESLLLYSPDGGTPFENQNQLFNSLTGLTGDLFTPLDMVHVGHRGYTVTRNAMGKYSYTLETPDSTDRALKWNYEMPQDGLLFIQVNIAKAKTVMIYPFDSPDETHTHKVERPTVVSCGFYRKGDLVSAYFPMPDDAEHGSAAIHAATFNSWLFDAGIARLDNPLEIDSFTDTEITGHIDVKKDGLLYTALPYEHGWRASVDGGEVDILPLDGLMAMLPLTQGEHEIRLWYVPDGFVAGCVISGLSLAVFLLLCLLQRRRPGLFVLETPERAPFAPLPPGEVAEDFESADATQSLSGPGVGFAPAPEPDAAGWSESDSQDDGGTSRPHDLTAPEDTL